MAMKMSVSFDPVAFFVRLEVIGELNPTTVRAFFARMGKAAQEHRCGRILTDLQRARIAADPVDIFSTVGDLEELGVRRTFRRAIVISRDHADYAFWETACRNRGFHGVQVFTDGEAARAWLLTQPRDTGFSDRDANQAGTDSASQAFVTARGPR
ncbi:MAG: hypothetical protein D6781_00565 [Verrucomicrobia bacterium]|nr:MAG: hypothetical protein D6781_00565 [Verrucomicrobiota bacterium]